MWRLATFVAVFVVAAGSTSAGGERVFILTVSPPEIVAVDTSRFSIAARVPLPGPPAALAIPGDRGILYLLVNGATNADGSLSKGPSEAIVFDAASVSILRRIELGWGASRLTLTGDGRLLLAFRDAKPQRRFERAPSVAVGLFSVAKQARLAHKPSSITAITTDAPEIVWSRELETGDGAVLYSTALHRFCVPDRKGNLKIGGVAGSFETVPLPPPREKRTFAISPSGQWLYAIENGRNGVERADRVPARIFCVDVERAKIGATLELENEPLTFEGTVGESIAVVTQSGIVRLLDGPEAGPPVEAGRHFRFVRPAGEDAGVMIAGKDRLQIVLRGAAAPSWTLDWHDKLNGEPGADMVPIPGGRRLAVPVLRSEDGTDLDRVAFIDLDKKQAMPSVAVGRRGRMALKTAGTLAAGAVSSPSFSSAAFPGPRSFTWNGFAVDVAQSLAAAFSSIEAANPLLTVSPDGRYAFAVSRFGNDLTIIRTEGATVVDRIPLGGGTEGVLRIDGSDLLCAWAKGRLTWIDMNTIRVVSTARPHGGDFIRVQTEPQKGWVVAFGDHSMEIWDGRTGKRLAVFDKLGKPRLLLSEASLHP